jgi:5-methylcytosine-specific restriction endonuclease McrA
MDTLDLPALVLNRNWQPIHVTTVVRALVMVWNETAQVMDPEEFRLYAWSDWSLRTPESGALCIRTGRSRLAVPEVICLVHFDRSPSNAVPFSRRNVAKRDHAMCQYCGAQPGLKEITIDHVIPRAQGGATSWTNCVAACVPCNARKANRTPEQAGMRLRRRPSRPVWRPAFAARTEGMASWSRFLPDTEHSLARA